MALPRSPQVALALLLLPVAGAPPPDDPCPLLVRNTTAGRAEVHAFHWDATNDPDPGDRAYLNNTPGAWQQYDWDIVTTVDVFSHGGTVDPALRCAAHAHGARVVIGAAAQNSPLWSGPSALNSSTHRTALTASILKNVQAQRADGINVDIEWPPLALRDDLTSFVCELSALLRREVPEAYITYDMPARPISYRPGTDAYDFASLIDCVDHFIVMDYDMATPDMLKANLSAPNSPLPLVRAGIAEFVSLGVPASRLVMAMPWAGMVYPCMSLDPKDDPPSGCIPWPPWVTDPDTCTVETGYGLREMQDTTIICDDRESTIVTHLLPLSHTGRQWDALSSSPFFDFINTTGASPKRHRVWYDDPESIGAKAALSHSLGLAGVGIWIANALPSGDMYESTREAMWAALRERPSPSPPPAIHRPRFSSPVLVSDSPFNDYADGFWRLPAPARHGTTTSGFGGDGLIFGVGAGRFTQSLDGGSSWTALPQYDGVHPAAVDDGNGYNPATPFFGPIFNKLTAAGTYRDWGHINFPPRPNVSYATFFGRSGAEFSANASGWLAHRAPVTAKNISFGALPHPVQCPSWYWPHSCPFWVGSGGGTGGMVTLADGTILQTAVVTYLSGHTNNPPEACGVFVFHSSDPDHVEWTYRGTVATAAQHPQSGEGPNENAISLLADGKTLTVVMRFDNGDGTPLDPLKAKNSPYYQSFSSDSGRTWSPAEPMVTSSGMQMGCARPQLLLLQPHGPLLLVGGRNTVAGTNDAWLWVNSAGDGKSWTEYSLSGAHNMHLPPERGSWAFSPLVNLSSFRATNGYSAIVQTGPRGVLVTYNRAPRCGPASHTGAFATNATCQRAVDALCNSSFADIASCAASIKGAGGQQPLVGRFTTSGDFAKEGGEAWRCYSPSSLDARTGEYRNGSFYCGARGLIGVVNGAVLDCDGCSEYGVCERHQGPVGDPQHGWRKGIEHMASSAHDVEFGRPLVFSMRVDF